MEDARLVIQQVEWSSTTDIEARIYFLCDVDSRMDSTTILGGIWEFVAVTGVLAKQLAGEFVKERNGNAFVVDKRGVKGKARVMPHTQLSRGSSLPGKKEKFFNNYYSKKHLKYYRCGKVGHIRRYFRATESNMVQTEKVVEEEEYWRRCLTIESQAIDVLAFINFKRD